MVCDGAMIASTVASLMMNGVCCMWQMQEEDDRRTKLRVDMRREYERQRLIEQALWERRVERSDQKYHSDSSIQNERRRRLVASKMQVAAKTKRKVAESGAPNEWPEDDTTFMSLSTVDVEPRRRAYSMPEKQDFFPVQQPPPEQPPKKKATPSWDLSSLLDSGDEGDDEEEMVEVPLQ